MPLLNIHTHRTPAEDEITIASFGLHPWHLDADWRQSLDAMTDELMAFCQTEHAASLLAMNTAPCFIGECGLDRQCDTPYDLQLAAFEAQIALSERLRLPLVLHCVKATDDILRLRRGARQPWIWHGFRGKPQQMEQLLRQGIYISFGTRHNDESLLQCPVNSLFLETDDQPMPISTLYQKAAKLRGTTPEALADQLLQNLKTISAHANSSASTSKLFSSGNSGM